ncbi:hypothetical protein [Arthrobacter sp. H20]|uniref:hypothetical protein n=1 Tax=Arthrobacter sp. H20 TaxID=1267981 RepID=UPI0004B27094|nr:hypothetical protein [Arthrobacter sp. H20]
MRPSNPDAEHPGSYPPPVYAVATEDTAVPPTSLVWWACAMAGLGLLMGVVWWLAAPGGGLYGDPAPEEAQLLNDLTLGGLQLVVGLVVGWLLVQRMDLPGAWQRISAAVGGSLVGSVFAVAVGQWLGMMFGADTDPDFVLRSLGAAAIWPAAAALVVFVSSLIELAWGKRRSPGHESP